MKPEIISAIQEGMRTFVIGEIFVLIAVLGVVKSGINTELGTFIIAWNVAGAVLASGSIVNLQTALGSAIDKFLHKSGVQTPLDFKSLDNLK